MTRKQYVVIGGGSQLAEVIREERKYRTDGYLILPLNNGTSDSYGMTTWMAKNHAKFTDVFLEWDYVEAGNYYRRKRTT